MIAGCSVVGDAEGFGSQDIDCSVVWGTEGFGGAFMVGFAYCCPSPLHALPHAYKWGNAVPMSIFPVACLGITMAWGIAAT